MNRTAQQTIENLKLLFAIRLYKKCNVVLLDNGMGCGGGRLTFSGCLGVNSSLVNRLLSFLCFFPVLTELRVIAYVGVFFHVILALQ